VITSLPFVLQLASLGKVAIGAAPFMSVIDSDPSKNCVVALVPRILADSQTPIDPKQKAIDVTKTTHRVDIQQPLSSFHHANAWEYTEGAL